MDWAALEETAYGPLDLKPGEFWTLTLREFNLLVDGFLWRQDHEWRRTAQLAAWVIAPHTKKRVEASDLYSGRSAKDDDKERKKYEESRAFFEQITRRTQEGGG